MTLLDKVKAYSEYRRKINELDLADLSPMEMLRKIEEAGILEKSQPSKHLKGPSLADIKTANRP